MTEAEAVPGEPDGATPAPHRRSFGLATATALVAGNIIGGGIFALPASVAPYGTISLVAFGVLSVGAVLLALLFGRLAQRAPVTGGLYVYPRDAFGDFAGFLSAWSYWMMTWVSNAALAVAAVGYLTVLMPVHGRVPEALLAMAVLWLPAVPNLLGTRWVGLVQVVSTVLKLVPLLLVAIGGLFFIRPENFGPFNAHGGDPIGAVSAASALLLYSYLGVESAAVSAGEVRDPGRNVGRASVLGTLVAAVVYLLGTLSVFGTVPHDRLVGADAPFSLAVDAMLGSGGGVLIAVAALVSSLGALNGWVLMSAQMPYAAARDGLFPTAFVREGRGGTPVFGVIASCVLGSLLILVDYAGGTNTAFADLVLITTFTGTVPYVLSAASQVYWLLKGARERVRTGRLVRDLLVAVLSFAFSMWLMAGAGYSAVYQGCIFLFLGIAVFVWLKARREATRELAEEALEPERG
ncbi:amino acid permease [Phaeacidiphilus oryzae]|uniref:amino acid permease n=1 Tax=Phaeacidiphilus oryzae TaxID=348818 RepID=UPI0005628D2C|nr:amino acid permease [Phaeacidiphilus oryzae]